MGLFNRSMRLSKRQSLQALCVHMHTQNQILVQIAQSLQEHAKIQGEMRKESARAMEDLQKSRDGSEDMLGQLMPVLTTMLQGALKSAEVPSTDGAIVETLLPHVNRG